MNTIEVLSEHQLYLLYSIDPALSAGWQAILDDILPKLDEQSQEVIRTQVLEPKGLYYKKDTDSFEVRAPKTLQQVLSMYPVHNKKLTQFLESSQAILQREADFDDGSHDIYLLADEIEGVLMFLANIDVDPNKAEHIQKQEIRKAFAYELAAWLDTIKLHTPKMVRKFTEDIIKSFFKEIFIKNLIQGVNFRYWEAVDLDLYGISHFPQFLKNEAKNRKLLIIETFDYWFVLAPAEDAGGNPFSLRRFLNEEGEADYVYLSSMVLPKTLADSPTAQHFMLLLITRIYSLDKGINDEIKSFALYLRTVLHEQLIPIFQEPMGAKGSLDNIVTKRVVKFEEHLTTKVLQRLPKMIELAKDSPADGEFLLERLERFLKNVIDAVENYRLHPVARYSKAAETLVIKLICFNILLQKNKYFLFDTSNDRKSLQEVFAEAMLALREAYESALQDFAELEQAREVLKTYQAKVDEGRLWQKLGFGKPKYNEEDLKAYHDAVNEEFFIAVIQKTKTNTRAVVFVEYETDYQVDEDYRHYAIIHEKNGFGRLPYLVRLPENRERFAISQLEEELYWEIFKQVDNV